MWGWGWYVKVLFCPYLSKLLHVFCYLCTWRLFPCKKRAQVVFSAWTSPLHKKNCCPRAILREGPILSLTLSVTTHWLYLASHTDRVPYDCSLRGFTAWWGIVPAICHDRGNKSNPLSSTAYSIKVNVLSSPVHNSCYWNMNVLRVKWSQFFPNETKQYNKQTHSYDPNLYTSSHSTSCDQSFFVRLLEGTK